MPANPSGLGDSEQSSVEAVTESDVNEPIELDEKRRMGVSPRSALKRLQIEPVWRVSPGSEHLLLIRVQPIRLGRADASNSQGKRSQNAFTWPLGWVNPRPALKRQERTVRREGHSWI